MADPFAGPGAFAPRAGMPQPPMAPQGMEAALAMHHQAMMAAFQAQAMQGRMPMMQPMMQPMPLVQAPVPPPERVAPRLLAVLRSSILPSEREMAADGLRRVDWKSESEVVPGLLAAAQADPAPMVRAASIRALGEMKANTLQVMQALGRAKDDADPRVRQQATQTIAVLGGR